MLPVPVLITAAGAALLVVVIGVVVARRAARNKSQKPQADNPYRHRFDPDELAGRLHVSLEDLQSHACSYRIAEISKPGGGVRKLEIPDAETMRLQRTILRNLLAGLNSHPFACGFEEHASIVDAALPHRGRQVVIKMDIRRFFESTTADRIQRYFEDIGWQPDAAGLLVRLITHNGHLPQGAPTSPRISNLVNAPLDEGLLRLAQKHAGSYSRYADDITMSFDIRRGRPVRGIIQAARRILRSYGYTMHGGKKLKVLRGHQQQKILGLVVNQEVALPRKTRRWLRAVKHRLATNRPATLTRQQLQGWEAFAAMVEKQRAE